MKSDIWKNELVDEVLFQTLHNGTVRAYLFREGTAKWPPTILRQLSSQDIKEIAERSRLAKANGKPTHGDSSMLTFASYADDMERKSNSST